MNVNEQIKKNKEKEVQQTRAKEWLISKAPKKTVTSKEIKEPEKIITDTWAKSIEEAQFGRGDGYDYHILKEAMSYAVSATGFSLEIGVREGAGSKIMIEAYQEINVPKIHIGLDPYGGIPYRYKDDTLVTDAYPNLFRDCAIPELFRMCAGSNVDFLFFQMTDEQFFKRFADGVPVYINGEEQIINEYGCVFFDGPHTTKQTLAETEFFESRASKGAVFIYDDVDGFYDHDVIRDYLKSTNKWERISMTKAKAVYLKNRK